ncbi:hypothetical protein O3Q51_05660 [Cryomorphaceae bacterium 1068]|nr:hypothetical protein [Cryomorphaceae bacterium 1068]
MLKSTIKISLALFLFISCAESSTKREEPRPLVYEGMSADELRGVLGEPKEIDDRGEIFDAQSMTKMSLQHWIYDKRVVILINDTVKDPNLN